MPWSRRLATSLILASFSTALVNAGDAPISFVHKKKYLMGTVFEIVAYDNSPARASTAIDEAFQQVVLLEGMMSNYNSDSDLSRLNRTAHFHALVNFWKAVMRGERAPSPAEEERLRGCVGYERVVLLPPDRVDFRSPCVQIDLGAIGKGFAVDRAVEMLRSYGISRALVNAGGSTIYAMGSPPGQSGWVVHLRDPSHEIDPRVMMFENSVSTSEQTAPSLLGTDSAGHIIDPQKGTPVRTGVAVSAVAKTATDSDALSTTLLLVGPEKGRDLVKTIAETAAIWISREGLVEASSNGPQILLGTAMQSTAPGPNERPAN